MSVAVWKCPFSLFLSLTSLAQLLFIPQGALRCHISEPPFLLSWCWLGRVHGRACAGVSSWWPGGCTRAGPGRQLSGQSLCHSAELHIYWFELNGGKTASQAGNEVYSNGFSLGGCRGLPGCCCRMPFPRSLPLRTILLHWIQGPMIFKGKMVVHAPLWEILTIHTTDNIFWAWYLSFSKAIPHE